MRHENPLAYLVALEGLALLRGWAGDHDADFTRQRLAEVRELFERFGSAEPVDVETVDARTGYRAWARTYAGTDNPAFGDEPLLVELVADAGPGRVLDAACGTGRHSRWLATRGHEVWGVDCSPEMLAAAREAVPDGRFLLGDLHRLPVPDAAFDVVVCSLALGHVRDLAAAVCELARVVAPGGRIVISDVHPDSVALGSVPAVRTATGAPARIATYVHPVGSYVRAALAAGLAVTDLVETRPTHTPVAAATTELGPWEAWPWSLRALVPDAAAAAAEGVASLLVLRLDKPS